ncbi:S8 family serine peptidase [Pontibacter sp. BT310]|uniref:S8 family serine peptidase n=1 Tax=Pontibacter populi TaxID=890055 RepID=A0ABS6XCT5_9BACT|nr:MULTISPECIES: S8 family serine peptidase [Pontibacter]MBJ6118950.1 S8 family serine peptidase [Pontibacter sp. BT310]MBR0571378.1 S8 family serine peptidase [Microvirga sp. STS03]MBW3365804.1 S8 family serine peptidase [Pontibacter populi]
MFTLLKVPIRHGCIAFILFLLASAPIFAQQVGYGSRTVPNTVVYKLNTNQTQTRRATPNSSLQVALAKVNAKDVHQKFPNKGASNSLRRASKVDITQIYQATYSSELSFDEVKRSLMATGQVTYVEPLYLREPFHQASDPFSDSTKVTAYYLKLIKAYGAWDIQQGDTNIVIGIADTGFRIDHLDLKNNIKYNYADPIDGIDNDGDGYTDNYAGWDFADRDNNVSASPRWKSHGMSVAGVAAATPNNATGITGVGYKTKFMPLKVFSSNADGTFGGGYEAIVYAAEKGCKIINLSWGGEGYSQYEQDIIDYVVLEKDVVVVSAAGNTKKQLNLYPASYNNVLSVGGSDKNDYKYKDYTWSHYMDLMAPGFDIYSTTVNNNNSYAYNWGSSFASPMVAGAAALVRAQFPELNAQQVMERLRVTTDDVTTLAANQPYAGMIGTGRLNIKKALLSQNLKAIRCTDFFVQNRRSAQSGSTVSVEAFFQNILSPVSSPLVTLSTSSPYVTISNPELPLGSMATMGLADNRQKPFLVTIAPETPLNTTVAFRLTFTDGNYTDFQYFELTINPDFHTLDANNMRITVNSKGNLGYNGLNFTQGAGVQYKGSNTLLFEGGLMIGTSPERVSDNLRNANWQNDGDFTPVQPARIYYDGPLATQEVHGFMRDIYPSTGTVGVEVKHKTLSWNTAPDQDYVIQEFTISNPTTDTLKNVAAALFADWDVGVYYQNAADWDSARNLGYVYNTADQLPVVGIKLLTPDTPIYYAINNMGSAGSIAVEDGFTNAEKYTMLSGGVTRTKANGTGNGDNVSHVVGGHIPVLAPGQSHTVTFAILSGDNLEALQQHADAAQIKYKQIKTGPAPVAIRESICQGDSYTWTPVGGTNYKFYADPEKQTLLDTGSSYTLKDFSSNTTIYATNVDSLFESALVPASFSLPLTPEAGFTANAITLFALTPVQFEDKSINGANWNWDFGFGSTSTEQNPLHTFHIPGTHVVTLKITDETGCLRDEITKIYEVRGPLSKDKAKMYAQLTDVFPNPSTGLVRLNWAADPTAGTAPEVWFSDQIGRKFQVPATGEDAKELLFDFTAIPNGIYIAHITYKDTSFIKRIVLMR